MVAARAVRTARATRTDHGWKLSFHAGYDDIELYTKRGAVRYWKELNRLQAFVARIGLKEVKLEW
jgi:hypothetical protein